MKTVRVANPGPAGLLVINPKRGKSMATKRRSSTTAASKRRKTTRRKTNPTSYASKRRSIATRSRRRSVSRRRNPSTGGLAMEALKLGGGTFIANVINQFVPPIGGVSPLASGARLAAVAFGAGELMKKFNIARGFAPYIQLGGVTSLVVIAANAYLSPIISGFLRPAPKPAENGNGVQGIGIYRPGMQPYSAYASRGLNGIAAWSPGQQPFNEFAGVAVA